MFSFNCIDFWLSFFLYLPISLFQTYSCNTHARVHTQNVYTYIHTQALVHACIQLRTQQTCLTQLHEAGQCSQVLTCPTSHNSLEHQLAVLPSNLCHLSSQLITHSSKQTNSELKTRPSAILTHSNHC